MRQPAPAALLIPVAAALAVSLPLFSMLPRSASNNSVPISIETSQRPRREATPDATGAAKKRADTGPREASRLLCQFFADSTGSCEKPEEKDWVSQVQPG